MHVPEIPSLLHEVSDRATVKRVDWALGMFQVSIGLY